MKEKVYIKTKNGNILECYVSEEMKKPIYYPIESKTNGYVDYYDVERFLGIDGMYREVKQLEQELSKTKKENEILTKNAEHNDKVVDKVNWENMFLKDKLKKIHRIIHSLVIMDDRRKNTLIGSMFNEIDDIIDKPINKLKKESDK